MSFWCNYILCIIFFLTLVNGAILADDGDVEQQGLYSKLDNVEILTDRNFAKKVYGQNHALLIQFYNSYCGHCRAFAPKFKSMAGELAHWKNVIKFAVLDCSVQENNEICREFEIMAYPSLRYLHANYIKGNGNVGDKVQTTDTADKLKAKLIYKMQTEQSMGRLTFAPALIITSYATYTSAIRDVPKNVLYTFLVFENDNSTTGSELALDISEYQNIRLKRVYDTSELADLANIKQFPSLVAVSTTGEATVLTPKDPIKQNLLKAINTFLKAKSYAFPAQHANSKETYSVIYDYTNEKLAIPDSDIVYYSDLEKTLKISLHTEIIRHKTLSGEPLQALLDFLDVLITSFPFRGKLKEFIVDLKATLATKNSWSGSEVYETVKSLEDAHTPGYTSNLDYISCRGSQPKYRGYTCGLWTLFHTLTVNASQKPDNEGPKILRAMHGYVKHFFGCTECAEHFQAMADRNRIFDVKENDKAVLWLWISHNEVNLRLAGDITEDPQYPKIQFPSISRCPECRLSRGAWNLPAVYQYLQRVYSSENIRDQRHVRSAVTSPSPFSNLDIGMLSLLYILSFIILILVVKLFLTKSFYRKRHYKHGLGKV